MTELELGLVANLSIETADEAKKLVPTLDVGCGQGRGRGGAGAGRGAARELERLLQHLLLFGCPPLFTAACVPPLRAVVERQ